MKIAGSYNSNWRVNLDENFNDQFGGAKMPYCCPKNKKSILNCANKMRIYPSLAAAATLCTTLSNAVSVEQGVPQNQPNIRPLNQDPINDYSFERHILQHGGPDHAGPDNLPTT